MADLYEEHQEFLGYIKYTGERVKSGAFDAKKSAQALINFDAALRYFISSQSAELRNVDFEIPVKIEKGSWLAGIPSEIETLVKLGAGAVATAYLAKAAQKMAERDFDGIGFKDLFKIALNGILWVAKIGKHLGNLQQKIFENVKFAENNELIGIPNDKGEYLYVPRKYFDMYAACSPKILNKLAANVDEDLSLSISVVQGKKIEEEKITISDRQIFTEEENELTEDALFPELVHGDQVVLEGEVTRGNKTSHSMGFRYQDHILTAYPETGNIVPYKPMLFVRCRLIGIVNRLDENGRVGAKRPKLIFSHLEPIEVQNGELF